MGYLKRINQSIVKRGDKPAIIKCQFGWLRAANKYEMLRHNKHFKHSLTLIPNSILNRTFTANVSNEFFIRKILSTRNPPSLLFSNSSRGTCVICKQTFFAIDLSTNQHEVIYTLDIFYCPIIVLGIFSRLQHVYCLTSRSIDSWKHLSFLRDYTSFKICQTFVRPHENGCFQQVHLCSRIILEHKNALWWNVLLMRLFRKNWITRNWLFWDRPTWAKRLKKNVRKICKDKQTLLREIYLNKLHSVETSNIKAFTSTKRKYGKRWNKRAFGNRNQIVNPANIRWQIIYLFAKWPDIKIKIRFHLHFGQKTHTFGLRIGLILDYNI